MSFIVTNAHVAKPTLGKRKEASQRERQNTRTSLISPSQPVTWQNIHRETHLSEENITEGLLIACEKPTLNKQVRSFIAKLFPFGITIEQTQVECKFPPCTPLMVTVRWKTF